MLTPSSYLHQNFISVKVDLVFLYEPPMIATQRKYTVRKRSLIPLQTQLLVIIVVPLLLVFYDTLVPIKSTFTVWRIVPNFIYIYICIYIYFSLSPTTIYNKYLSASFYVVDEEKKRIAPTITKTAATTTVEYNKGRKKRWRQCIRFPREENGKGRNS